MSRGVGLSRESGWDAENEEAALAVDYAYEQSRLSDGRFAKMLSKGKRLPVSEDQLWRWRNGRALVPYYAIERCARYLGLTIDELIAKAQGRPTPEADRARALREEVEAQRKRNDELASEVSEGMASLGRIQELLRQRNDSNPDMLAS